MPKKPLQTLTHSENKKVSSHVQREEGDWYLNTIMIDGCDIPFQYKRKKPYKSLTGARVNMSYYLETKEVGGLSFEIFKVVSLKRY